MNEWNINVPEENEDSNPFRANPNDLEINCKIECKNGCGPLQLKTVKKIGPNTGRKFISCNQCENFKWLDVRPMQSNDARVGQFDVRTTVGRIQQRLETLEKNHEDHEKKIKEYGNAVSRLNADFNCNKNIQNESKKW